MPSDILLKNTILITLDPPSVEARSVLISEGRVVETGRDLKPTADCDSVELRGKLVLPGLVDAHSRLSRSLSLGLPPGLDGAASMNGRLAEGWRRFDEALADETLVCSAFAGAMEAIRAGTTVLVDMLSAPQAVQGSLGRVSDVVQTLGMRGILSYETSEADGPESRDRGLTENRRWIKTAAGDTVSGMVGAAPATSLSDEALKAAVALAQELKSGLHLSTGGIAAGTEGARASRRLAERLLASGAAGPRTVLAQGARLSDDDVRRIDETGACFVHCPRSDMLDRAGHATALFKASNAALGTDGARPDIFEEARAAFFKARDEGLAVTASDVVRLVTRGHALANRLLGLSLGSFEPGATADFVVLDYNPNTPVKPETIHEHFLFGMGSHQVESVIVDGRFVLRSRRFPDLDVRELTRLVRRGALAIRKSIEKRLC